MNINMIKEWFLNFIVIAILLLLVLLIIIATYLILSVLPHSVRIMLVGISTVSAIIATIVTYKKRHQHD